MAGKVILIAGARGTGKTTLLHDKLKTVSRAALLIYDPAQQYKDLYPEPFVPFSQFSANAMKVSRAVIAIEEATIYLSNRGYDSDVVDFLVNSNQRENIIFLVYHSLRAIPTYIFDLADGIFLKRTNDNEKRIDSKFDTDSLTTAFRNLQANPDKFATVYLPINSLT